MLFQLSHYLIHNTPNSEMPAIPQHQSTAPGFCSPVSTHVLFLSVWVSCCTREVTCAVEVVIDEVHVVLACSPSHDTVGITQTRRSWWVERSTGGAVNCTTGKDQALHFLCLWKGLEERICSFILNLKGLLHKLISFIAVNVDMQTSSVIIITEERYLPPLLSVLA